MPRRVVGKQTPRAIWTLASSHSSSACFVSEMPSCFSSHSQSSRVVAERLEAINRSQRICHFNALCLHFCVTMETERVASLVFRPAKARRQPSTGTPSPLPPPGPPLAVLPATAVAHAALTPHADRGRGAIHAAAAPAPQLPASNPRPLPAHWRASCSWPSPLCPLRLAKQ